MAYFRKDSWTEDLTLKEELSKFERQGIQQQEMLSFLGRDFPLYACSLWRWTVKKKKEKQKQKIILIKNVTFF